MTIEEIVDFFDEILETYEPAFKIYRECLEALDPPPRVYTSDRTDELGVGIEEKERLLP